MRRHDKTPILISKMYSSNNPAFSSRRTACPPEGRLFSLSWKFATFLFHSYKKKARKASRQSVGHHAVTLTKQECPVARFAILNDARKVLQFVVQKTISVSELEVGPKYEAT